MVFHSHFYCGTIVSIWCWCSGLHHFCLFLHCLLFVSTNVTDQSIPPTCINFDGNLSFSYSQSGLGSLPKLCFCVTAQSLAFQFVGGFLLTGKGRKEGGEIPFRGQCSERITLCRQLSGQELKCFHYSQAGTRSIGSEMLDILPTRSAHPKFWSFEEQFIYHNIRMPSMMSSEKCYHMEEPEKSILLTSLISLYWNGEIILWPLSPSRGLC